jgi:hypothetical protein
MKNIAAAKRTKCNLGNAQQARACSKAMFPHAEVGIEAVFHGTKETHSVAAGTLSHGMAGFEGVFIVIIKMSLATRHMTEF